MNVPKIEKETKGIDVEDLNVTFVFLDRGIYLIDDEIVRIDSYNPSKVQVEDFNNIRIVDTKTVPSHYTSPDGDMSIVDYESKIEELTKNAIKDGSYCYFSDEFLDEEYEYKKFKKSWILIEKTIQTFSDPIKVEVEKIKYDTGNPFVQSAFFNGENKECELFVYKRLGAIHNVIKDYMEELGFKFTPNDRYDVNTEWTNSTHSGIRYAKAFDVYLFGDEYNEGRLGNRTGTMKDMLGMYESDKIKTKDIIYKAYVKRFGQGQKYDGAKIIENLESCVGLLNKIDVKIKSDSDKKSLTIKLNKIIKDIYATMEAK